MYTHAQVQSGPASTSTTIFPDSQYRFPSPSGAGFSYDPSTGYASFPIPRSSSSSLASALDSEPEATPNDTSGLPSCPTGQSEELLNGGHFVNQSATSSAEDLSMQTDMSTSHFAKSSERRFDVSGTFRADHQIYQGTDSQIHVLNQSQSMGHYSYAPLQSSSSTSYIPPQQPATYMQSNGPQWPPDVSFPAYAEDMSMPPALATNVGEPFPGFSQDYSYAMGVGEGNFDVYGSNGGAEGWVYAQGNPPFQGSDGNYLGFDNGSNAAGNTWFENSFGQHDGFQNASFPASSASFTTPVADTSNGRSSASSSNGTDSSCFDEGQNAGQQIQQGQSHTAVQGQCHSATQAHGEEVSESLMIPQEQRPGPSPLQSNAYPVLSAPSSSQTADSHQGNRKRRQYRGHNELMPPPPLPPRVHTPMSERQQHVEHPPQTPPTRRHTVAVSLPHNEMQDRNASPVSTLASTRSSSAAPESSSSNQQDDNVSAKSRTPRPRMATLTLNDAMWSEAQERDRDKLTESFRIHHGRDPPPEMRIRETSALERSRKDEPILLGTTPSKQLTDQAHQPQGTGTDSSVQSTHGSEGTNVADGSSAPPASEAMSEDEFFNPRADWVPARSGEELAREAQARIQTNTHPLTSPISPVTPATTDSFVTPTTSSDTSAPSAIRQVQMKYAFHAPANPDAVIRPLSSPLAKNVLAVIRHDGHLPQHISGVGGTFQNAYDGRSYLTDDSEDDPEHVPPAPPGARSGDHPALAALRPHPLKKRGEAWHDLINPMPPSIRGPGSVQQGGSNEREITPSEGAVQVEDAETLAKLEKEGVEEKEQGEGWGFTEGGSHGSKFALSGSGKAGSQGRRLKLTTEKKAPPKIACHFCRNRKIACSPSKCGDPTICNQCERRNIRCIFPTESRRGMRTKNQRRIRTIDGTDEVDNGFLNHDDISENRSSGSGSSKKGAKSRKQGEKEGKNKDAGRGKGKGKRTADASNNIEASSKRANERDEQNEFSPSQSSQPPVHYANDPLASLAAKMQWPTQNNSAPPTSTMQFETTSPTNFHASSSSSSGAFQIPSSFEISFPASDLGENYFGPSPGPFTSTPLQRRA